MIHNTSPTWYMFVLSIVVIAAFFAVLDLFLLRIAGQLRRISNGLAVVSSTASHIREHCSTISPSIEGMNQNLYEVAAHLSDLGDAAEELANTDG
jgi:hypothetical protein